MSTTPNPRPAAGRRRRNCGWIFICPRSNKSLAALALLAITSQLLLWIVYYHPATFSATRNHASITSSSSISSHASDNNNTRPPRLLIGIISNANNHMGLVYRDRHRQLFQLWNDSRLCLWKEFDPAKGCLVAYTFVLGGHNASSSVPPFHLDELSTESQRRPLTLDRIPSMPRYKDVIQNDVTILNIRENMNEGKTPTFFHWATGVARRLEIDYIMKCDSDAFLRWNALWRFMHKELAWATTTTQSVGVDKNGVLVPLPPVAAVPSTLLGAFRHKAYWNDSSRDETLWQQEWYAGMHLYLAGQLYVLSVDVAEAMVQEARKWYTLQPRSNTTTTTFTDKNATTILAAPYFAGHEDHDATSMIQQNPRAIYRWVNIPKHTTFWEHPVKGDYRWQRILAREQRQQIERLEGKRPAIPSFYDTSQSTTVSSPLSSSSSRRPSFLAILLNGFTSHEETAKQREAYLKEWKRRIAKDHEGGKTAGICSISKYLTTTTTNNNRCNLYYVFVVGIRPNGPTEVLSHVDSLLAQQSPAAAQVDDTWFFNVHHTNNHQGIGTTLFYYLHETLPHYSERLELIVLIQSDHWLQWNNFQAVVQAQASSGRHALVVGEMRDKYQEPRDFPKPPDEHESFWYDEFDNIHLYLGSDCLAFGSSLVAGVVAQAQTNTIVRSKYWENNLGHDMTVLAYFVPKVILHWVPITKSIRFWES